MQLSDPLFESAMALDTEWGDVYAITRRGVPERPNADRFVVQRLEDASVLLAVADGLGGDVGGERAAQIVREEFLSLKRVILGRERMELDRLARRIDHVIYRLSLTDPALANTGSTLTAVLLRKASACWVHVGDSRAYLLRNRTMTQLTQDHTLARFLVAEAQITPQQVATHYSRHVMDQWVGCGEVAPETGRLDIMDGDLLLLSSDGLHKYVGEDQLSAIVTVDTPLETSAKTLLRAALEQGGTDDITIVMARNGN